MSQKVSFGVQLGSALLMLATVFFAGFLALTLLSYFTVDSYKFVAIFLVIILASNVLAKLVRTYVGAY
jgi:hypothetical protein